MANVFRSVLAAASALLQSKSVTAGTSDTTVTPDSGYDGLSSVTVSPTPTETASATPSTTAQTITPSSGKHLSSVSISAIQTQTKSATPSTTAQTITPDSGKYLTSVSVGAISTETKTQAAGTSNIDVTPTSGKYLTKVTITPQQHSATYTPATNKSNNDMGASHNYRYVNTSGMITPSGNKAISANGTGIDVASYSTVSVAVPDPTLSGDAAKANVLSGKTFYNTSTTKQTGTMTNNGAVSKTLSASERSYTVPAGYHNGSGSVTVPAVTATKRVGSTSTSVDVASDDWTVSLNCGDRLYLSKGVIADGYSQGAVAAASLSSQTGVDSGKTAIDASHVFSGYQGWVNGSKVSGTYSPPTINSIVPKDSAPPSMSVGSNYSPTKTGYVYETIHTVPSGTLEATTSANGTTSVNVEAYSTLSLTVAVPNTPYFQETTLWTNSSSTTNFAAQSVTLSQSMANFDYLKIRYAATTAKQTNSYCGEIIVSVSDMQKSTDAQYKPIVVISTRISTSGGYRCRRVTYSSDTSIAFSSGLQISGSNTSNDAVIPLSIKGLKLAVQ